MSKKKSDRWPDSITVNTCRVPIEFVKGTIGDGDRDGEYRNTDGSPVIRISSSLEGEYRDFVVCHEILHAWIRINGLAIIMPDDAEERLCDTLGHELARLLRELRETDG